MPPHKGPSRTMVEIATFQYIGDRHISGQTREGGGGRGSKTSGQKLGKFSTKFSPVAQKIKIFPLSPPPKKSWLQDPG
uniref:Candidate secreted effector n=1 Tax=Meloidogyne incognita TaxID=6306 RepID=A0A914M6X2_MELIC